MIYRSRRTNREGLFKAAQLTEAHQSLGHSKRSARMGSMDAPERGQIARSDGNERQDEACSREIEGIDESEAEKLARDQPRSQDHGGQAEGHANPDQHQRLPTTMRAIRLRSAPSAIRMPISLRRLLLEMHENGDHGFRQVVGMLGG